MNFIDLSISNVLPNASKEQKEIVRCVKKFNSGMSILNDLEESLNYLDLSYAIVSEATIRHAPNSWDTNVQDAIMAGGLQKAALSAYFRSVDNGNKGRYGGPLLNFLNTEDLKNAHNRILVQRHNSVAHFGVHAEGVVKWCVDNPLIIIDEQEQKARVINAHVHWNSSGQVLQDLKLLLDIAVPACVQWNYSVYMDLIEKLKPILSTGELFKIFPNKFSYEVFFETPELAAEWKMKSLDTTAEGWFEINS